MKIKYDSTTFLNNFKCIISDCFGVDATLAKYIITPVYDPKKNETGEDGAFRFIILSEDNISGKRINFNDTLSILTAFEPHYPTKIEILRVDSDEALLFEIKCSTRVRKPSAIANIDSKYAPFSITQEGDKK
jgi:hypothetical protein